MNLSKLNNLPPFEVNNTLINETTEMIPSLVSNANQTTSGYFGLGLLVIFFLFLMIILMQDQEVFRFEAIEAFIAASGITFMFGLILFITNLISSFQHVVWFGILFIVALLMKIYNR